MSDWGDDEGAADFGNMTLDLPDVEITTPIPEPSAPASAPPPTVNAWAKRSESNDVRNLRRGPVQRGPPEPRSAPAHNARSGPPGGFGARSDSARGVKLYVTGLTNHCTEEELQSLFADCGQVDVRLQHHSDTGNIKAAIITLEAGVEAERGLAKNNTRFFGRSLFVKIDGSGRRDRDRGGYNHPDGGFRGAGAGGGYGNGRSRDDRRSGYGFNSDNNRNRDRDRDRPPMPDMSIPTGEVPAGRRKLNLKPRTKPLPKLDIDRRHFGDAPGSQAGSKKNAWERKGTTSSSFSGAEKRVPGDDRTDRNGAPERTNRNAPRAVVAPNAPVAEKNQPDAPAAENGQKSNNQKVRADDDEWNSVGKGSGSAAPPLKADQKKSTSAPGRPGLAENKQAAAPKLKNAFDVLGEADE